MRIVSLLPSATDIVVALGAEADLVGVSHSCALELPKLTRTWLNLMASQRAIDDQVRAATQPLYELDIETLAILAPDVVVSQSLCEVCALPSGDVLQAISDIPSRPKLIDLNPQNLADVPNSLSQVAKAIGRGQQARAFKAQWDRHLKKLADCARGDGQRVVFLDWLDPPFIAGHWLPDMLKLLNAEPLLIQSGEPSYETDWDAIRAAAPDRILAACCGLTMNDTRNIQAQVPPDLNIELLDGYTQFSRPSPTLMESLSALNRVLGREGDRNHA